ncbi:pantoate--beta-alanine ligase [Microvirga sp. 2TAF3]|uniref:pantoate--beta-alanine ligase n=1 Tax=Microvirga sp. 2TAF3 TaxID=3233014 RepID=UPI003F94D2E0
MPSVPVIEPVDALRETVSGWRQAGRRIALVPTMGALHEGPLSLVRLARHEGDRVVASIFVNPTQFAPGEDFSKYPRTFEDDRRMWTGLADLVFAPNVQEMYPPGDVTRVRLSGPASVDLKDRFRPTHFEGVATIVAKLLNQVQPDIAVFGGKDFQQLKVIERMVEDLHMPVRILPGPTVREASGIALSSRNRFLSDGEAELAASLFRTLSSCAEALRAGGNPANIIEAGCAVLSKAGFQVDYLELRDTGALAPPTAMSGPLRLLVAARLGQTRLIDNIAV